MMFLISLLVGAITVLIFRVRALDDAIYNLQLELDELKDER
jgi:hypothetical protein